MVSFSQLSEVHAGLDAAFAAHQYALLHFDFACALAQLEQYESALLAHMLDEEKLLLPLYAERASIEKGGGVELFMNEHEKMRSWVKLFLETTDRLGTEAAPEPLLIKLLDRESFYKKLCSHHDIRETRFFFPALDMITSDDERSALFKQLVGSPKPRPHSASRLGDVE